MTDTTKIKTLKDLILQKRRLEDKKKHFTDELSIQIKSIAGRIEKMILGEDEVEGQMDITDYLDEKAKKGK